MKKILFVSPTGTLDNGAEISITNLMVFLSNLGYTVYNTVPTVGHRASEDYTQKMNQAGIRLFHLETRQWWWEEAPAHSPFYEDEKAIYYQKNIFELRKIIREEAIDVVVSNTVNVFQGAFAAAAENVRHIWLIHEFPLEEFAYYKTLLPCIESLSDSIFSVDGNLETYLKERLQSKDLLSSFIPFSHVQLERELPEGKDTRIVSIGRINENKNQLELLEAYELLSQPRPDLVFIGGWDDSYKKKCDQFIAEKELDRVSFSGNLADPWEMVTNKDMLVINSKMETFGLVYVEGLLNGVPVLASDNLGYQSVKKVFESGQQYALGNVEELVTHLSDMIQNFEHYKYSSILQRENVREKYIIENAYKNILTSLDDDECRTKMSLSIASLFGGADPFRVLSPSNRDNITIYFGHDNQGISENNAKKFSFQDSGIVEFKVAEGVHTVRVDMTERPSYFETVKLVNSEFETEIIPNQTNAVQLNDSFFFFEPDPQIFYDVSKFPKGNYRLIYQSYSFEEEETTAFLPRHLVTRLLASKNKSAIQSQRMNDFILENQILSQKNNSLKEELKKLTADYHAVIGSRRWIIPTKIINFLRRKK